MYREEKLLEVIKSLMTDNETKDYMIKAKNYEIKELREKTELYRVNCKEWKDKYFALEKEFNKNWEDVNSRVGSYCIVPKSENSIRKEYGGANSETKLSINVGAGLQDLSKSISLKDVKNIQKFLKN